MEQIDDYFDRVKKYVKSELAILKTEKYTRGLSPIEIKRAESKHIFNLISSKDYVILLDNHGKQFSSMNFSKWYQNKLEMGKRIVFIVGGAYGFDESLYERADGKLSLSQMTFSHQNVRGIFLEQLYRAHTILNNEKYHNE